MGYQAEQRVLAVLKANHGRLTDSVNATRKMRNYMAVSYAENSVSMTLQQLERRGVIGCSVDGGVRVAIFSRGEPAVEAWAIEELGKAIGNRKRQARRGITEHAGPEEWAGHDEPRRPALVGKGEGGVAVMDHVHAEDPAVKHPGEIDYRRLADNLLLEVMSILTDDREEAPSPEEIEQWKAQAEAEHSMYEQAATEATALREELATVRGAAEDAQRLLAERREALVAETAKARGLQTDNERLDRELTLERSRRAAHEQQVTNLEAKIAQLQQLNRTLLAASTGIELSEQLTPGQRSALNRILSET